MMKRSLLIARILLASIFLLSFGSCHKKKFKEAHCSFSGSYLAGPTGEYPQEFSVQGNLITNQLGEEIVFRGASIQCPSMLARSLEDKPSGGQYYFKKYLEWDENIFSELSSWGANIVRLPVYPAVWRKLGTTYNLQKLDEAIEWAAQYHLYVIIDWHSIGFPPTNDYDNMKAGEYGPLYVTSIEETVDFWDIISERYQDNPSVAFYEIFNEPTWPDSEGNHYESTQGTWNLWKGFAEQVVEVIRINDPNKLIVVGCPNWSYDLQHVLDSPISGSGVVYATHPYPGVNSSISWDQAFGKLKDSYPVFATEIGYLLSSRIRKPYWALDYSSENGGAGHGYYHCELQEYLENSNISWCAWSFSPYVEPKLLDDKCFKPTHSGEFFKNWMQDATM